MVQSYQDQVIIPAEYPGTSGRDARFMNKNFYDLKVIFSYSFLIFKIVNMRASEQAD